MLSRVPWTSFRSPVGSSLEAATACSLDIAPPFFVGLERLLERKDDRDVQHDRRERPDREGRDERELRDRVEHDDDDAEYARPRALSEDPEADEDLDDSEDEKKGAPGREVGEEQSALGHGEIVVFEDGYEALQGVDSADEDEERPGERIP